MFVKQAGNVLELLEYFARRQRPATMPEIARDLGWPRSSTFNLIETLTTRGYLYEPRLRSGFYPSPRWGHIADQVAESEPLPETAGDLVAELAEKSGETTSIVAPAGTSAIFLRVAESSLPIRYFAQAGHRVPIHASSSGRALLAQFDQAERNSVYRKIEFGAHPRAPASVEVLEAVLASEKQKGFHFSDGEFSQDLVGVSIPLPVPARRLSITIAGPRFRCLERVEILSGFLHDAVKTWRAMSTTK